LEKSIDFYIKHLGLQLLSRREITANNAEIAFLRDPEAKGAVLELAFYRNQRKFLQSDYENRLFDHLAFDVQDINGTLNVMRKTGIVITDEPFRLSPSGPLIAFVEDPDGTLIELIQRK
jgi:lactoylglutathione lyase